MNESTYDVIIVGGGIVGAMLAGALADSALRLAVIEAKTPLLTWPRDSVDLRVSAITPCSMRMLTALGVWPDIAAERISPFREMHVWDAMGSGLIHFDSAEIGAAALGYIVENRVIQAALFKRLQRSNNVDWVSDTRIRAWLPGPELSRLSVDDGREFEARLVVGADGPDSLLRRWAGIKTHGWDHRQTAVIAVVKTTGAHRETAWQRFLPEGPLAFLPLSNGDCSIVWSTTPERAEHLCSIDAPRFIDELQVALGSTTAQAASRVSLGTIVSVGARTSFPLRLIYADRYVQPRLALIGDAAHTIHPLAGQGVNLGLRDAATLAEILLDARNDIGALPILRRYERRRKGDNLAMIVVLESLKQLFASRLAPLRWLRSAGLNVTDAATPIKNGIMRRAMGLHGDLPNLAQCAGLEWKEKAAST